MIKTILISTVLGLVGFQIYINRNDSDIYDPKSIADPTEIFRTEADASNSNDKKLVSFSLQATNDKLFVPSSFLGKWTFLYAGYTSCPDVCPVTLSVMKSVRNRSIASDFETKASFIFLTLDPKRDNLEKLQKYSQYFIKDMLGVRGDKTNTKNLLSMFHADLTDPNTNKNNYVVDHPTSIFLVDPNGGFSGAFLRPNDPEAIFEKFKTVVNSFYLQIKHAEIRLPPPGSSATSAYLNITNQTSKPAKIEAIESRFFGGIEIHETKFEGGNAKMREIPSVELKPSDVALHGLLQRPFHFGLQQIA